MTPLHAGYLAAVGRAVAIGQEMEDLAKHVGVVTAVTEERRRESQGDPMLAERTMNKRLARLIEVLEQAGDFGDDTVDLDRGRLARNWIAHESCLQLPLARSVDALAPRLRRFVTELRVLVRANHLLAIASFEIAERKPAPFRGGAYCQAMFEWAFEPFLDGIGQVIENQSP